MFIYRISSGDKVWTADLDFDKGASVLWDVVVHRGQKMEEVEY